MLSLLSFKIKFEKKKEKMTKIIEYSKNKGIGFYEPILDIIFLNEKLQQFPYLREKVLEHELQHSKAGMNYFKHFLIDVNQLKNNFKDKQLCIELVQGKFKSSFFRRIMDLFYLPFALILSFLNIVPSLIHIIPEVIKNPQQFQK